MIKKKIKFLVLFLLFLNLLTISCGLFESTQSTKSGSGSSTGSVVASPEVPAHGQVTVNLLERAPFKGKDLDPAFWTTMEGYCKAGPTQIIIADMNLVPVQMSRAGFVARWAAQCYALATTYAGMNWSAGNDAEGQLLSDARDQMNAWWSGYIQAVVQLMKKAPQTTAVIIVNDGLDRLGSRLGDATLRDMGSVQSRLTLGDVIR
jgi:hypothetical protein